MPVDDRLYQALFVNEIDSVGIYDIYYDGIWIAQCRYPRRQGADVYLLFQRNGARPEVEPLKTLDNRNVWRAWLVAHQCTKVA
jgi:hypothetical protein